MRDLFRPQSGDREAVWVALGLWGLTYATFVLSGATGRTGLQPWLLGVFLICIAMGLAATVPVYLLIRQSEGMNLRRRATLLSIGAVVAAGLVSWGDAWAFEIVQPIFQPELPHRSILAVTAGNLLIYLWIFGLYVTAVVLISAGKKMRERERQLAEARTQAHQAQLAALRFQLNPHFLFNTLNAISTLIVTRSNEEAEAMMQKLSEFLRASLAADPAGFVALQDELDTVEAYLDIEMVRFGERLRVEVVCPPELLDALVPSFLLQPLVENAVKYAVAPAQRTVTVRVEATGDGDDLVLAVEDDGDAAQRGATRGGTGVGLSNVRDRLKALYGDRGVLEATPRSRGFLALARLPLTHSIGRRRAA